MKENKKNRNLSLLLILAIISLVALVATFARYTGEVDTASDTAKVARWDITMNELENGMFTHAYTENILSTAGADKIIAPGVDGNFKIVLNNNGDVAADITSIVFSEPEGATNAAIPMKFSIDGTTWVTSVGELNTLIDTRISGTQLAAGEKQTDADAITVQWKWEYQEEGDEAEIKAADDADSVLGKASAAAAERTEYTLTMTVNATQAQPGPVDTM